MGPGDQNLALEIEPVKGVVLDQGGQLEASPCSFAGDLRFRLDAELEQGVLAVRVVEDEVCPDLIRNPTGPTRLSYRRSGGNQRAGEEESAGPPSRAQTWIHFISWIQAPAHGS